MGSLPCLAKETDTVMETDLQQTQLGILPAAFTPSYRRALSGGLETEASVARLSLSVPASRGPAPEDSHPSSPQGFPSVRRCVRTDGHQQALATLAGVPAWSFRKGGLNCWPGGQGRNKPEHPDLGVLPTTSRAFC